MIYDFQKILIQIWRQCENLCHACSGIGKANIHVLTNFFFPFIHRQNYEHARRVVNQYLIVIYSKSADVRGMDRV